MQRQTKHPSVTFRFREGRKMGKWEPILWIIGSGIALFVVLMLLGSIKSKKRKS